MQWLTSITIIVTGLQNINHTIAVLQFSCAKNFSKPIAGGVKNILIKRHNLSGLFIIVIIDLESDLCIVNNGNFRGDLVPYIALH